MRSYQPHSFAPRRQAFSLLELALVLVVIGLLVGGILSGKTLLHASELKAITTEFRRFNVATKAFKEQYYAYPGDMQNATAFWGKHGTMCPTAAGTLDELGTCNGNGDNKIAWCSNFAGGDYSCKEPYWYWQQLALSGYIEGTYFAGEGSGTMTRATPGVNVPISKYPGLAWGVNNLDLSNTADVAYYSRNYGNYLFFGPSADANYGGVPLIKAEDAYALDSKIDDGKPGTGNIVAGGVPAGYSCAWSVAGPGCVPAPAAKRCTSSTNSFDFAGSYMLTNSELACYLNFVDAF